MELAVDEVAAEIVVPSPDFAGQDPEADSPDWRAAATEAVRSFRATALRHPWLSSVLGQAGLAYLGPNLMSFSERLAALFTAAGFPEPSRAIDTVLSYVIGMSTTEAAWLTTVARSGETEAAFIARLMPAAQQAAAYHDHLADSYAAPWPSTPVRSAKPSSPTAWTSSSTAWRCGFHATEPEPAKSGVGGRRMLASGRSAHRSVPTDA